MKNAIFEIGFDESKGTLISLVLCGDPEKANFIKTGRGLCEIHATPWYGKENMIYTKKLEEWRFDGFCQTESLATAVFSRKGIIATQTFTLTDKDLRISIELKNTNFFPVYFKQEDLSLYTPFADSYDDSLTCQKIRCHAHMAPFKENSYVRTERMGVSKYNVGLLFLKGSVYSYSQEACHQSNDRGYLLMNVDPFTLIQNESYRIELAVFAHEGGADFFEKARSYEQFVSVSCDKGYVLEKNEECELVLSTSVPIKRAKVSCGSKRLAYKTEENAIIVPLKWSSVGEKKISYEINGRKGEAYYYVSLPLHTLQKRRAHFIVKNQQCLDERSPLYGAYLIYDNEEKTQYFSYEFTDHNANRERMGMPLFLVKYMRKTGDRSIEKSVYMFTEFLLRECVEEDTGKAFNNIGKEAKTTRLYNAPWVILYFCELFLYDGNQRWINLAFKMILAYYENGGTNFYPNGIRFSELKRAFEKSGNAELYQRVLTLFDEHIRCIEKKGTAYPPHEVNYEQTIVTPAACLMLDKYLITRDSKYIAEAEKHLVLLEKFNGCQPDYRLNKVPLRYWDDYWFGKMRSSVYGDTMPQPALAHSAHCFYSYGVITNDQKWIDYGVQLFKRGFYLFNGKGEASCAYVYPARVNGRKGAFLDPYANDQDGYMYLVYKITEPL